MYTAQGEDGLGFPVAAVAGVAAQALKSILPTGFQTRKQRDKARAKRVDALAKIAVTGNADAIKELTMLSKSSATQKSKDYAKKKLTAVLAKLDQVAAEEKAATAQAAVERKNAAFPWIAGAGMLGILLLATRGKGA